MADQKIQLTVQVNSETGQLEVLGAKFDQVSAKAKQTKNVFSGLSGEAGSLIKSFLPFATAGGIIAFFTSAVKGAEEQNEAFRRLQFTIEGTGKSWEKSKQKVEQWTSAVAASTRFSDGEAIAALDKFTRVTGSLSQAQSASLLAMDLSVASGKDLSQTISLVTDLLNGNERALIEVRREYGEAAGSAKTTQEAIDLLSKKYEGAATKSKGLTDETAKLVNSFGQLKDTVGNAVAPALTWIVDKTKLIIEGYQKLGVVIAGIGAALTTNIGGPGSKAAMQSILDGTLEELDKFEAKKKAILAAGERERLLEAANAAAKHKADEDAKNAELLLKKKQQQEAIYQQEQSLESKLAALDQDRLRGKLAALNVEYAAEQAKNAKVARSKAELNVLNRKLDQIHNLQVKKATEEELFIKQQLAFDIANTAVQTLQTLNSLGQSGSAAEKVRARALLALQQAIAIGWAWVAAMKAAAETGNPALAYGLAAAQTALLTAQFAQGLKRIDQAAAAEQKGIAAIPVTAPVPGIDTGAPVSGGEGGFFPTGRSGGGTGGTPALQFVITFNGDIIVTGVNGAGDIADRMVDVIGEKLIERIKGLGQISFTGVS